MTGILQLESAYDHYMRCKLNGVWVTAYSGGIFKSNSDRRWNEYINRMGASIKSYIEQQRALVTGKKKKDIDLRRRD